MHIWKNREIFSLYDLSMMNSNKINKQHVMHMAITYDW